MEHIEAIQVRTTIENNLKHGRQLLFHGSKGGIIGPISCNKNNALCDFGLGFYTGTHLKQAENRVVNKADGILYAYEYDLSGLNVYQFTDDILWAFYIGYNRHLASLNIQSMPVLNRLFKAIDSSDVIIGKIADDKISLVYTDFMLGNITDECLSACLQLVRYGDQYVFKTTQAINSGLKLKYSYSITKEIREESISWNKELKQSMNTDIEKIKLAYRRRGKFIDECMEVYRL